MKKTIVSFLILALSNSTFAQTFKSDSTAIRTVLIDFFEVFTHPDMKHYERNCAPEFQLLENGEVWRKPEFEKYVKSQQTQIKT